MTMAAASSVISAATSFRSLFSWLPCSSRHHHRHSHPREFASAFLHSLKFTLLPRCKASNSKEHVATNSQCGLRLAVSASRSVAQTCFGGSRASHTEAATGMDHVKFIKDVAACEVPVHLQSLLNLLHAKGDKIVSPENRRGIIPLAIPLAEDHLSSSIIALLRWPTPPEGMELPVVQVQKYGVFLLAKSVDQYMHRLLVEADVEGKNLDPYFSATGDIGRHLYSVGDFMKSKFSSLDAYLLKMVGLFPDVFERLALKHLERGDEVSALVSGEFYATKGHFPGFGRPIVFNAELMLKVGRKTEARDAAKIALKLPWWTLGNSYEKVAEIAGWGDEKIEYMKEKITEDGKKEELQKGKALAQVALDQGAFLLDLATVDGSWDDIREPLASCYTEAGLENLSKFINWH
ncbi:hypothetical protein O6H91_09G080600 [Diphasiastrum complanatum]|nr:hypothetical protein O6H91_09G080600 [Diphasiastrum complanatum]